MEIKTIHLLAWLLPLGFLSRDASTQQLELQGGYRQVRSKHVFAFLVFLPVFCMAVFGRARSDTVLYLLIFRQFPSDIALAFEKIKSASEPGLPVLMLITKTLFGNNETAFRIIIGSLHSLPLILVLRKYSEDYVYSVFLFIALGNHLAWMMNGLRQFIAVCLIFAGTPLYIERRTFLSVLLIIIAVLFHRTALVFLPIIFIVRGEPWNLRTVLFSLIAIAATFIFAQNVQLFDRFAESSGYSLDAVREYGDDGTNPIRVLASAVPTILSLMHREAIRKDGSPMVYLCVNMSMITTGIYLVSMVTSGIMVGRMPIYTSLYGLILLPVLIRHYVQERFKHLMYVMSIVLYLFYFFVQYGVYT